MNTFARIRSITVLVAGLAAAGTTSACMASVRPRSGVVYVRTGPPARIVEVRPAVPGRNYIWIDGHHEWRGNAYVWIPGRYEVPASGYARWQAGQWKHDRNGWYWVDGHWR